MTHAPSPDALAAAFRATDQPATPDEIGRLAAEIARHGSADRLALALAHDESGRTLALLNVWQAFQAEDLDPSLRIARLRREALALDHHAESAWAEGAEMHGKAAGRRLRDEHDLAEAFERRALAAERFAADLEAKAFAKRLKAASLEARAGFAEVLAAVAA